MNWNIYRLKKKTGPNQIRTVDLCRHMRIRYLRAKCAGDNEKFEFIMKQCPVNSYLREKKASTRLQYPCLSQE